MNSIYEQVHLDRNIPVPLYYQLKKFMLEHIDNGDLKEGDPVPSEEELCNMLNVSRATIRQAFTELVKEGRLTRQKAKGTFIAKPKIRGEYLQVLSSFNDEMRRKGLTPSTKVLRMEQAFQATIAEQLGMHQQEPTLYIERLRFADGDPMVYVETYLPYEPFKTLMHEDIEHNSLYSILDKNYGSLVHRVTRIIQVGLADSPLAKMLDIRPNSPIYIMHTSSFTADETPIAYSISKYRGDRNEFRVDLVRG